MSWEVEEIYEYFKQMKADYVEKARKQGALVTLEGRGTNERPSLCEDNVSPQENENRVCEEDNRDREENDGHGYYLPVQGPCHESGVGHVLEGECSGEMQELRRVEEDRRGRPQEVLSGIDDYYMDDTVHRNEEGGRTGTLQPEAADFENCTETVEGMEHGAQEFSAAHGECGQTNGGMQKERPKRRRKGNCNEEEAPRTGRKMKERASAFSMQCETVKDTNTQSEVPIIDIGRFSEVSKKVIVKHAMGCDNLAEVMKGISAFAKQLPGYRKSDFARKNLKERRTLELEFVTKWALEERVVLRDVDLSEGTGMVNVHSAMLFDK